MNIELTEEQQTLYDYIINNSPLENNIVLNAPAGTGKTTFVQYLIHNSGKKIQVIAPTHKAKSLFTQKGIKCDTIHRFLNSEKNIDHKTGEIYFDFNNSMNKQKFYDLIIVDECSMVNEEMYSVFERMNNVIFVGDSSQLPPVNEDNSPVFKKCDIIFSFTKNLRLCQNHDSFSAFYLSEFRKLTKNPNLRIRINNKVDIKKIYEMFMDSFNDIVLLAWTNKQVAVWNDGIRRAIFNKNKNEELKKYYVGEKLIFGGYRHTVSHTYYSSEMVKINELSEKTIKIPYNRCDHQKDKKKLRVCKICDVKGHRKIEEEIKFYQIIDQYDSVWYSPIDSINLKKINSILSDFKKYCINKKNKDEWIKYYDLKNSYNPDLKYKYSMTVHKSQGSSWDTVAVDIGNIRLCRDMKLCAKLSYTAVSRFRDKMFFI